MSARTASADLVRPRPKQGSTAADLLARLARVEKQIALGRQQFARQLEVVAEIERSHGDADAARHTLQLFARAHVMRLDDRDRLTRLLDQARD